MKGLEEFILKLKSLQIGSYDYEYSLDDDYFAKIEAPDIKKGAVKALVTVVKRSHNIEISFHLHGEVSTLCDRCLEELMLPIEKEEKIFVKFGKEYVEESEDLIVIPEDSGVFDISWLLYEFIVLSLPICRQHEEGGCDEEMQTLFSKYIVSEVGEADELENEGETIEEEKTEVDPRWAALKNIFDNN